MIAARRHTLGDGGALRLLPPAPDYTELLDATAAGSVRRVLFLLGLGVPVDPPPRTRRERHSDQRGTALHAAARHGHAMLVRLLLHRGADKTRLEPCGATPIHLASLNGHTRCVRILLAHGVSVDQADRDGRTPLQEAVQGGYLDTARLLIAAGANPNGEDSLGRSALAKVHDKLDGKHPAAMPMRTLLLEAGAVDEKDGGAANGRAVLCMTPLHAAAETGSRTAVARLLRTDPQSVHVEHFRAGTALHIAARRGDPELAKMLLAAGAKPDVRASLNGRLGGADETPLLCAASAADPATVRAILAALPPPKHVAPPVLHCAARQRDGMAVLELLLEAGADPRAQVNEETARDVAATPAMRECLRRIMLARNPVRRHRPLANANALAKLIAAEGPTSRRLPRGDRRPLHAAADARSPDIIALLLNAGAELEDYDLPPGWSASTVAPLRRPQHRQQPEWASAHLRDIADGVADGMGDIDWRDATDERIEIWCAENPHMANSHYPGALTPLHMAAWFDRPCAVAALVRHGACLEKRTLVGDTPLTFAARRAGTETVRTLLEAGADLRVENGCRSTNSPLHEACLAANTAAATALIDAGADVNATAHWNRASSSPGI